MTLFILEKSLPQHVSVEKSIINSDPYFNIVSKGNIYGRGNSNRNQ
ncbi:hypothetical protein GCM10008967_09730 [Bacillus carboniphilus]|uniref:Uncharacterized protein n=1 Tax=Bacillus carboniphilus TaxID=86663 RepID=A0ABN0VZJ2_9BACI